MAKTDWGLMDAVRPSDMNQIGTEINTLRNDVDHIEVPPASLTKAGIVQLSNSTDGTREDVAATEKAVSLAFQAGNERKAEVVAALVAIGVPASTNDSWDTLIGKMTTVIKATGNAAVGDVLVGKTFSNVGANGLTGTMPNQGAKIMTPGTANQTIAAGYHNGAGYVVGDPNLIASNIRDGVNIFGASGTLKPNLQGSEMLNVDERLSPTAVGESIVKNIITLPAGTKFINFVGRGVFATQNVYRLYLELIDQSNNSRVLFTLGQNQTYQGFNADYISYHFDGAAAISYNQTNNQVIYDTFAVFNTTGSITLRVRVVRQTLGDYFSSAFIKGNLYYG